MTKSDIFKNFLTSSLSDDASSGSARALADLEALLADSWASNQRIAYLEALDECSSEFPDLERAIPNPLTEGQMTAVVEKGLVQACWDDDVPAELLLRVAHSVEGMRAFSDALLEIPQERHAPCWKEALSVPFELAGVELPEVSAKEAEQLIWDEIRRLMSEWVQLVAPPRRSPALGFRGSSLQKTRPLDLESPLPYPDEVKKELEAMSQMAEQLPESLREVWPSIPWGELVGLVDQGYVLEEFILRVRILLTRSMDEISLSKIRTSLKAEKQLCRMSLSQQSLIGAILQSSCLPDEI